MPEPDELCNNDNNPPRKKRKTLGSHKNIRFGTMVCFCTGPAANVGAGNHQQKAYGYTARAQCDKNTVSKLEDKDYATLISSQIRESIAKCIEAKLDHLRTPPLANGMDQISDMLSSMLNMSLAMAATTETSLMTNKDLIVLQTFWNRLNLVIQSPPSHKVYMRLQNYIQSKHNDEEDALTLFQDEDELDLQAVFKKALFREKVVKQQLEDAEKYKNRPSIRQEIYKGVAIPTLSGYQMSGIGVAYEALTAYSEDRFLDEIVLFEGWLGGNDKMVYQRTGKASTARGLAQQAAKLFGPLTIAGQRIVHRSCVIKPSLFNVLNIPLVQLILENIEYETEDRNILQAASGVSQKLRVIRFVLDYVLLLVRLNQTQVAMINHLYNRLDQLKSLSLRSVKKQIRLG